MRAALDRRLRGIVRVLHEQLGLSPNQVSLLGLLVGFAAAGAVASGRIPAGLALMALAQIVDALDGAMARQYMLQSARGAQLETLCDRLSEAAMFAALVVAGEVHLELALLAMTAILLVTLLEPRSHFDPGFKRFMLYFGWLAQILFSVRGFELAMHVIFLANLTAFAVGTVIVDYRLQKEVDAQDMERRALLQKSGGTLRQESPTFLSRVASWF
ncbi:MAG TPA: CDP-alcohol phosphatidyltransferase family protein [Bacteroidota bacterium]|nr:CDP-alcohol phosphatidyltransferase family protein [Bacteroidota bacterium]